MAFAGGDIGWLSEMTSPVFTVRSGHSGLCPAELRLSPRVEILKVPCAPFQCMTDQKSLHSLGMVGKGMWSTGYFLPFSF